jgi:hypothetical protein
MELTKKGWTMKQKFTLFLLLLIMISGCTVKEETKLNMLVPMGAPSISVIPVLKEEIHSVNLSQWYRSASGSIDQPESGI